MPEQTLHPSLQALADRISEFTPRFTTWNCQRCGRQDSVTIGERVPDLCNRCRQGWQSFLNAVPRRYKTATLTDLSLELAARIKALQSDRGMYLWGLPGVGKTHAMFAVMRHAWGQMKSTKRAVWEDFLLDICDTFRSTSTRTEKQLLAEVTTVGVLVIDDLGVCTSIDAQESDFALRVFLHVLDGRLEHCLPTFITSNKTLEALGSSFDERIMSRLVQAVDVVKLVGPDRRREGSRT